MDAPITTKHRLFAALATGGELRIIANNNLILEHVQMVQREDGSGRCWNVTGYSECGNGTLTRFVRTID